MAMLPYGAHYGSFVVRFTRRMVFPRFTFEAGETLVMHKRHWSDWNSPTVDYISYPSAEIPKDAIELVADYREMPEE